MGWRRSHRDQDTGNSGKLNQSFLREHAGGGCWETPQADERVRLAPRDNGYCVAHSQAPGRNDQAEERSTSGSGARSWRRRPTHWTRKAQVRLKRCENVDSSEGEGERRHGGAGEKDCCEGVHELSDSSRFDRKTDQHSRPLRGCGQWIHPDTKVARTASGHAVYPPRIFHHQDEEHGKEALFVKSGIWDRYECCWNKSTTPISPTNYIP